MNWFITDNSAPGAELARIPELSYAEFYAQLCAELENPACHLGELFAMREQESRLRIFALLLDDTTSQVKICSYVYPYYCEDELPSITARHPQAHPFEREISELYGIRFSDSPWDKPLRYPARRAVQGNTIDNYPFYKMEGESLHEVNVGPIHAGIIEPGAFRFICHGEKVLHLEIALGFQHRGVEEEFLRTDNRLRQTLLAESIAGDTAVAHATAFAAAIEKLSDCPPDPHSNLDRERAVALELERMAMHIADTGALCMDIGYQLGQVACEALRTMTINTTQIWCGNRFGKGLVRPFGSHYHIDQEMIRTIRSNVAEIKRRYNEVRENLKDTPSVLARFEQCGEVSLSQMTRIGGVGVAAKASGLCRDVRWSHPWGEYLRIGHRPIVKRQGDIMARLTTRCREVLQSAEYIDDLLSAMTHDERPTPAPRFDTRLAPLSLAFSLVEGWRGEICHCAVTDRQGALACYKVKDPSMHNWLALALAVRGAGISDFPINNKSFNLSYCGHDL